MLIVFTGNGKGKTTAALGQAVRVVGRGKNVLMIQFIKGPWKSGEDFAEIRAKGKGKDAAEGEARFELRKRGLGFVGILGDQLPREEHARAAREAFAEAVREVEGGAWGAVVLDEVNVAVSLGLLGVAEVLAPFKTLPPEQLVIFTGRGAPQEFLERADLVTEMREIKHPFNDGNMAKIAIEF